MKKHHRLSFARAAGFTLIELMVTIAVAAVLLMVAAPSFIQFQRNSELTSAANSLVGAISAARGEALKRGVSAVVTPADGSNWSSGWNVFVDTNNNQILDPTEYPLLQQGPLPTYFGATGRSSNQPALTYIRFDASGYSKTSASVYQSATLTIQRTDLAGSSQAEQTRILVVAMTGRVRVCKPSTDSTCTATASE